MPCSIFPGGPLRPLLMEATEYNTLWEVGFGGGQKKFELENFHCILNYFETKK